MPIDVINTLKTCKAFSGLSEEVLKKILHKFQRIFLYSNEKVFLQGEASEGVFLLLRGKLVTLLKKEKLPERIVTIVHPGDTVGEMGAFSHEPRTTTVKAVKNSTLLKLSSKDFRELCNEYPTVILQAMNTLAKRSHHIIDALSQNKVKKKHIIFLPADKNVPMEEFSTQIKACLVNFPEVVILSDYDSDLIKEYKDEKGVNDLILNHINNEKVIIYFLNNYETLLSKICFDNIDIIYVVGNGDAKPQLTDFACNKIKDSIFKSKPELILLHTQEKHLPKHTSKWMKLTDFRFNHHLRMNNAQDFQRMSRFIRGEAVGLVLGGGGIRSWAHVGVIKALTELKIPIDFIAGTSGGAIVGGYYAMIETYKDPQAILRAVSSAANKTLSLSSLTWPAISISNSEHYTLALQKIFAKVRIENLWRPFFCVSCNLEKNSAVIQRRGLLWEKIRSSTSIPGVFPPVVIKGKIYLDDGITDG